ncbi:hypothetical protein EJB05_33390, partial [Eragrostis curvula]
KPRHASAASLVSFSFSQPWPLPRRRLGFSSRRRRSPVQCKMPRYDDRYDQYDDRYDRYNDRYDRYNDRYDRYNDRYDRHDRYDRSGRHGSNTKLYVGQISPRIRTEDLEDLFGKYGRVQHVDLKRDFGFVEFSDPRDADDARCDLDGQKLDGSHIVVEFARGVPRGPGGRREYMGRGAPVSGPCFNCGVDGHFARDCEAGNWKNRCYRCGENGHIERNCQNPRKDLNFTNTGEGEATRGPHLLVVERTKAGIMAGVAGVTVGRHLQGRITVVLVTRNCCQETTAAAPRAPRQGRELNTMVRITVGAPGEVTAVGALAPTTEVLTTYAAPGKAHIAMNWKPGL